MAWPENAPTLLGSSLDRCPRRRIYSREISPNVIELAARISARPREKEEDVEAPIAAAGAPVRTSAYVSWATCVHRRSKLLLAVGTHRQAGVPRLGLGARQLVTDLV